MPAGVVVVGKALPCNFYFDIILNAPGFFGGIVYLVC